jgi:hypothetical protein
MTETNTGGSQSNTQTLTEDEDFAIFPAIRSSVEYRRTLTIEEIVRQSGTNQDEREVLEIAADYIANFQKSHVEEPSIPPGVRVKHVMLLGRLNDMGAYTMVYTN